MGNDYWNVHDDFATTSPKAIVKRFWLDDELNRQRSAETFQVETGLVDDGLELYLEAIQGAFRENPDLDGDQRLRASVAMLIHALNTFLAWRHLVEYGYLAEGRLFSRNIHESLTQALAFANDETLAKKFYEGRQISARDIQKNLSSLLANENIDGKEVFNQFNKGYQRLGARSHPTLASFALRTFAQEFGTAGLGEAVPEKVAIGGFLQDDLGRVFWLGFARDVGGALRVVGQILKDSSGGWATRAKEFQDRIAKVVQEDEIWLDKRFPK